MRLWVACGYVMVAVLSPAPADAENLAPRMTTFLGVEGAFDGFHVSSGVDVTLGSPVDSRGLALRFTGGAGLSRFRIDPILPDRVVEATQTARLLVGWRESGGWGVATLFVGAGMESRRIVPAWPDPHTGTRFGAAVALDAWLTPMERVAIHVFADYTSAYRAGSLRIAPGYDLGWGFYVGPEATLSTHHETLRTRVGLHVTGLKLWDVGIRLSGGYATDRGGRSGAYGALSLWRRY